MTNAEKYKSAGAQSEAFNKFCARRNSCDSCPIWDDLVGCRGRRKWEAMTAYPEDEKEWKEVADNRPVRVLASAVKDSNVEVVNDPGRKYAIDKLCEYATNLERNCLTIWQEGQDSKRELDIAAQNLRVELAKTTNRLDKMRDANQTLHTEMDVAVQCIRSIHRDLKSKNFLTNVEMDILERCAKVLNRRYSISYI